MTAGYLSKDRDHLNRMQRERRARLVRIDYHPDDDALALIDAKRPRYGPDATHSATLNAIVSEWAELSGIKKREVERPKASGASGVSACFPPAPGPASDFEQTGESFGPLLRACARGLQPQQRVPCLAKRRRDGQPCQALSVPGKRRCKWHGGCSTGPKTPEGKAKSLANLRRGGR